MFIKLDFICSVSSFERQPTRINSTNRMSENHVFMQCLKYNCAGLFAQCCSYDGCLVEHGWGRLV